jgi:hypothetical protein
MEITRSSRQNVVAGLSAPRFPDTIRVLTWGYSSSIKDDRSTTSITAISRNFLEDIKRVRDKEVIVLGILLHHDIHA